uniref:Uncharacterized protein n=1 Tax=Rhizophora mucronata TaxID=61149 RepID=A0A2P2NKR0_RHIMU
MQGGCTHTPLIWFSFKSLSLFPSSSSSPIVSRELIKHMACLIPGMVIYATHNYRRSQRHQAHNSTLDLDDNQKLNMIKS